MTKDIHVLTAHDRPTPDSHIEPFCRRAVEGADGAVDGSHVHHHLDLPAQTGTGNPAKAYAVVRECGTRLVQQAALLDQARDAIIVRDLDHRVTYVNPSAEDLYGFTAAELLGERTRELYPDPADFDAAMAVLLATDEWHGELALQHRDGTPLVVDSRWTLLRHDDGTPTSVLVIDTDITERRRLEAQLIRAQRLESLGTLAGGVAHDLNNVLTPILMGVELLRTDPSEPLRGQLLDMMKAGAHRGADIIRQILTFARGVEGNRVAVDVDALVGEVAQIAEDTFLKAIRIQRHGTAAGCPVLGDPTQLHQVLLNLCVNARDAMASGGTLGLGVDVVEVDAHSAAPHPQAMPGRHVRIAVTDDGEGMPADVLDRIFDPFYTTKPQGAGTGLGLSVSASIVASHGGFIDVDSQPGRGSRFRVHLPVMAEGPAASTPDAHESLPRGSDQLVMVVDDEPHVRKVLQHTLETFGYRVVTAADGPAALALQDHRDVSVVIVDLHMPIMDGVATIQALRGHCPDLPVIATSGVQSVVDSQRIAALGVHRFLPKPCPIGTLLHTLQDVWQTAA